MYAGEGNTNIDSLPLYTHQAEQNSTCQRREGHISGEKPERLGIRWIPLPNLPPHEYLGFPDLGSSVGDEIFRIAVVSKSIEDVL